MKRVLLLGATGMLGSAVYGVLKDNYDLIATVRSPDKVDLLERVYGRTSKHLFLPFDATTVYEDCLAKRGYPGPYFSEFIRRVGEVDHVINAIGITIPFALRNPSLTFFINGSLPHLLAFAFGERLIHITTDCVYNGTEGYPYDEYSPKSPPDVYGHSKSLGEPSECLTIRTSIIGRELVGFTGLLEWFLQQQGKKVSGFAEHYWNGITTKQFGLLCDRIMTSPGEFPRRGIYHVFSTPVSKCEMLLAFQRKYGVRCTIEPKYGNKLNRLLTTKKQLNTMLSVPPFEEMLAAL